VGEHQEELVRLFLPVQRGVSMARLKDIFRVQTLSGDPLAVQGVNITPQSQAVVVRWANGGWVWNRPVAVLVERDGETERIPMVDVTRMAQLGLFALSIAFSVLTLIRLVRDRRNSNGSEH
jgi:hypothetical protein